MTFAISPIHLAGTSGIVRGTDSIAVNMPKTTTSHTAACSSIQHLDRPFICNCSTLIIHTPNHTSIESLISPRSG